MDYKPFQLMKIEDSYVLTAPAGFRAEFFAGQGLKPSGDLLQAVVCYLLRVNGVETSGFDFDSETGAFVMRGTDQAAMDSAATLLAREINRDEALLESMSSEEVLKEKAIESQISDAMTELMSMSPEKMSPEELVAFWTNKFPG